MSKGAAFHIAAIAMVLGTAAVALAQGVPTLDYKTLCRAEAKQGPNLAEPCMSDQKKAHEDLVRQWAQFPAADRRSCLALVNTVPGMQSYIELLTCLQLKQDVRALPKR